VVVVMVMEMMVIVMGVGCRGGGRGGGGGGCRRIAPSFRLSARVRISTSATSRIILGVLEN
jgi:hypothetical protein